ncbi:hypothetical protein SAMN04488505_10713 [Chitinophaga rupis]|uniref:Transcriptional regulator, AlpA family n=1 Tax=Chitinophaga rupis TaxID=573321 RepID=A0A1H8C6Z5_9BACT|nr:DNA-binding protein [Chitinophaga rupis]SEM90742.1 hypothetical protein SAMN04488505_10713 [Chitinophaga rupis]
MSSNLNIKKVCQHCQQIFIAKKITTKFCSLVCAQRNYKLKVQQAKLQKAESETAAVVTGINSSLPTTNKDHPKELLDITTLAYVTTLSERTLYRMMEDPAFPKIKIDSNLRFHKETVIKYIIEKYTVYERKSKKKDNSRR